MYINGMQEKRALQGGDQIDKIPMRNSTSSVSSPSSHHPQIPSKAMGISIKVKMKMIPPSPAR
jgi:hypothetical protein